MARRPAAGKLSGAKVKPYPQRVTCHAGQSEKWLDRCTAAVSAIATVAMLLMLVNVFYDAIMRYFFRTGSIALQVLVLAVLILFPHLFDLGLG